MALESAGFFSPDGLCAERVRTIQELFFWRGEPARIDASTEEAYRKASQLTYVAEGRIFW